MNTCCYVNDFLEDIDGFKYWSVCMYRMITYPPLFDYSSFLHIDT